MGRIYRLLKSFFDLILSTSIHLRSFPAFLKLAFCLKHSYIFSSTHNISLLATKGRGNKAVYLKKLRLHHLNRSKNPREVNNYSGLRSVDFSLTSSRRLCRLTTFYHNEFSKLYLLQFAGDLLFRHDSYTCLTLFKKHSF